MEARLENRSTDLLEAVASRGPRGIGTGRATARYPDFIGIGAARSGTTWLCKNLESHPGVWIPRIKELHYFTCSSRYNGPSQLDEYNWAKRLFSREQKFSKYRSKLINAIGSNLTKPSWSKLKWDTNYLLRKPDDGWYASLFTQARGRLTGEITPRYCELELEDIRSLKRLMPKVKIFFLMRNPVERIWSLIRYHEMRYGRSLTDLGMPELIELADHPGKVGQNNYKDILDRWRSVFPPEQFFFGFYDEISDCPQELLDRLGRFLGLDFGASPDGPGRAGQVFNASEDNKPMPPELRAYLEAKYGPMISELAAEHGGYFRNWRSDC